MARYTGQTTVEPGVYLSTHAPHVTLLEARGQLPGAPATSWHRVPRGALLVLAPVTGLVFVVFLPLLGIGLVVWIGIELAAKALSPAFSAGGRVLRPAWEPALAYFGRRRRARRKSHGDERTDQWAEQVESELDEKD